MNLLSTLLKRLGLAISLILVAAAMLLWSDRYSRHRGSLPPVNAAGRIPIALLLHSSSPVIDETRKGLVVGLAAHGFKEGETISITTYNPEGDLPTGNLMAQKIAGGNDRLAISISTVMLQALANANRNGRLPQVFGAVTSPVGAGVGIKSLDSLDKPPQLTGIGTPQPVADIFRLAKQINPKLKTVGVVWNPAEVNSEISTQRAREVSRELGITLLEAPIEGTKDIREAAESLVSRGVEAFWTGGDATVSNAVDSLMGVAQSARIPVFSNIAGHVKQGGLFDLGASYFEVGQEMARIASEILAGKDPSQIPVRDFVPSHILLNEKARQHLRGEWRFDDALKARSSEIIGVDGAIPPGQLVSPPSITPSAAPTPAALDHPWKLKRILYVESLPAEEAVQGMDDGFKAAGLMAGRDYVLTSASAQGDMSVLPALADATNSDGTELLIAFSTPTLQTAVQKIKHLPVVFTFVADPVVAGAGQDNDHHLPHITGIYTLGPYTEMVDLLARDFPQYRRIGTLFSPAEDNSVHNKDIFVREAAKRGITVTSIPVNSPGELPDAALAIAAKPIDAIVQILDNQSSSGFTAIAGAAVRARKPLLSFIESGVRQGAAVGVTTSYHQAGYEAAMMVARIMRGESPAALPFARPGQVRLIVSENHARRLGMSLPPDLVQRADVRLESPD